MNLPSPAKLSSYRIWDAYFTPAHANPGNDGKSRLIADIERSMYAVKLGCIEKLCYFAHVGIGTTGDKAVEASLREKPELISDPLKRWPDKLIAMIQLNANDVHASTDAIHRWIRDGTMAGVYFSGSGPGAAACTSPNIDTLVGRVIDVGGLIMQHTWFKTGGKRSPVESTPSELRTLARRYPQQKFICAHAGGDWERGICAIRDTSNVLIETSGFDATAGFIEMAVREVGAHRIVFGSHLPSRSLATELAKVIGADINDGQRKRILGENFRQLLAAR